VVAQEHGYSHPWSHKGHLLAFDGDRGISLLDADTGATRLLRPTGSGPDLFWAPDDRSIAYNDGGIGLVTLAGASRTLVSAAGTAGGSISTLTWTRPAGRPRFRRIVPRAAATVSPTELAAPWKIERLTTAGDRVAYTTCGHLFIWTPKTGALVQAEPIASLAPACATSKNYVAYEIYDIALGAGRIAYGIRSGNMSQSWELYQAPLSSPSAPEEITYGYGYAGCTVADDGLGDLVAGGSLLFFSRWKEDLPPAPCGVATSQQIFRLDPSGCPCSQIASSPGPLAPMDVDGARVVAVGNNETLLLDATGGQLLALHVHAAAAQLDGAHLVVLVPGELRDYDASNGALLRSSPLPNVPSGGGCGSPHPWACPSIRLELDDASHGLAAYVYEGSVHVLRLADGTDKAIGAGTTARFMDEGLVYADGTKLHLVPFSGLP
jgi:hypothetical protein